MRIARLVLCQAALLGLASYGCGETGTIDPPSDDGGGRSDAGAAVDGGGADSAMSIDAQVDGGALADAGEPLDAGEPSALPACPMFSEPTRIGERMLAASDEASGLMASRRSPGVFWYHDDSGDTHRAFAMSESGAHLGIYDIADAEFRDWEDMGLAQLEDGAWYLVMGDIGGNAGRELLQVYLVPEPSVSVDQAPRTVMLEGTVRLDVRYPDGEHNAEGLFVDPDDDAIYIVTKSANGRTQIFVKAAPHVPGTTELREIATLDFSAAPLRTSAEQGSRVVTAADISPDGDEVLLKTYTSTFLWRRAAGATIAEALMSPPCPVPNSGGETIAFSVDGDAYYTTTEPDDAPIFRFDRR